MLLDGVVTACELDGRVACAAMRARFVQALLPSNNRGWGCLYSKGGYLICAEIVSYSPATGIRCNDVRDVVIRLTQFPVTSFS
jgi:hypothetical protein